MDKKSKPRRWPLLIVYAISSFLLAQFLVVELMNTKLSAHPILEARQPTLNPSAYSPVSAVRTFSPRVLKVMALALEKNKVQLLESQVRELISLKLKQHEAENISVYFEDLGTHLSFGIDENTPYVAASLFKVPRMMAALKKAESDKSFLNRRAEFRVSKCDQEAFHQTIVSTAKLQDGQSYSVEELLYRLIVHSDNEAICALDAMITEGQFDDVLRKAGVLAPNDTKPISRVGARQFGMLLLALYNATYLSHEMSLRALRLLSRAEFHDGLVAGIPASVAISHKFGEWGQGGENEFHDCGIVYKTNSPYVLCVMTHGKKLEHLIPSVADVSRMIYSSLSTRPI